MTHAELIAALEKADGPSGILDMHIANATDKPHREYTSSIDAALTLVPEGWCWNTGMQNEEYTTRPRAYCWKPAPPKDPVMRDAATPALALCVAALKALDIADRPD